MSERNFSFENLDVYRLSVRVNEQVMDMSWPRGRAHLKDQAIRAADSMVLNLTEGWGRGRHTAAGKNHFRIAKGSAAEVFTAMVLMKRTDLQSDLRRIGSMLHGLQR
ncbi:MAG: four helix bundle protein [Proteobacteria bacterium]|nr:four helix bundle protein [Pseudomonadota bacterium]